MSNVIKKILAVVQTFVVIGSFCALSNPNAVLAQAAFGQSYGYGVTDADLGIQYGSATGLTSEDPRLVVARIIRVAMGLLGIIALVIVLIAGFTWMTAGGNDEKIGTAKSWLWAGVVGLVIILSSYALATFIVQRLVEATQQGASVNICLSGKC